MGLRWNEPVWNRVQAIVLWTLGAAGIVNELFIEPRPRPEAFPIIGLLVGLPIAKAWDQMRQARSDGETEP